MTPLRLRSIITLLLLLACPLVVPASAAAAAARQQEEPEATAKPIVGYLSRYQLRYMDVHAAETLAWDQCPKKDACRISGIANSRGATLEVTASAEIHARLARVFAEHDAAPPSQTFQLVILAAGNKPNGPVPALTPGAQKALDDIKGFLPFKHYRVLDTVFLRVTQGEVAQAQVAGLLGNTYELIVRFQAGGLEGKQLFLNSFILKEGKDENLISTSFSMNAGETVVVGTSAAPPSEEALVAILTALP
jgi:hypothetical protein